MDESRLVNQEDPQSPNPVPLILPLEQGGEAMFRALLESAPDAMVISDQDGRIVLVNSRAEKLLGYSREEMIGQPVEILLPQRFRGRHLGHRAHFGANPHLRPMGIGLELYAQSKDGRELPVEISLSPLKTPQGMLITSAIRDISERKRAEAMRLQLIREQSARAEAEVARQQLAFLADASSLLTASLDYETTLKTITRLAVPRIADYATLHLIQEDGKITPVAATHADPAKEPVLWEFLRQYPPGLDLNTPASTALRTRQPQFMTEWPDPALSAISSDQEMLRLTRVLDLKSGMVVPILVRRHVVGLLTFVAAQSGRRYGPDDLTLVEEVALRAGIAIDNARLYREAQEAIRSRDEFLSIASHELKTPLTSMQLQADNLLYHARKGTLAKMPPDRLLRMLEAASRQTERLTNLVNELLDVSRISAGRLSLELEEVDLAVVARDVVERYAAEAIRAGSTISLHNDTPVIGYWDRSRLDQVITNLLSNALKYGNGKPVEVIVDGDQAMGRLTVNDQGIGIPPDRLTHVFERFERAVSGRAYSGMGLGLYIASQIVQAHGGQISVQSQVNQGSSFVVELPRGLDHPLPDEGGYL